MPIPDGADHIPDTREIEVPAEAISAAGGDTGSGAPNYGWASPIEDPDSEFPKSSDDAGDDLDDDDNPGISGIQSGCLMMAGRIPEGTYHVPTGTTIVILKRDRDGDFEACFSVATIDEMEGTFHPRFERYVDDAPDCGDDHWVVLQDGTEIFFLVRIADIAVWPG